MSLPLTIEDPVRGTIYVPAPVKLILNSQEVQRLRDLRQLGLATYVYPSATHSRFEHSVGCMHLALTLLDTIVQNHRNYSLPIPFGGLAYLSRPSTRAPPLPSPPEKAGRTREEEATIPHKEENHKEAEKEGISTTKRTRSEMEAGGVLPSRRSGARRFRERSTSLPSSSPPLSYYSSSSTKPSESFPSSLEMGERGEGASAKCAAEKAQMVVEEEEALLEAVEEDDEDVGAEDSAWSKNNPFEVTNCDRFCVAVAGLCHDLGHGPLSHAFEKLVNEDTFSASTTAPSMSALGMTKNVTNPKKNWEHEEMSLKLLDNIWRRVGPILKARYGFTHQDHCFIKLLMKGLREEEPFPCRAVGRPEWKRFMVDIVANKVNGLDVDKLDYLQRDGFFTGHRRDLYLERIFQNAFVVPVQQSDPWGEKAFPDTPVGQYRICYAEKVLENIASVFETRILLHKLVYQHKVVRLMTRMAKDVLQYCKRVKCIPAFGPVRKRATSGGGSSISPLSASSSTPLSPPSSAFHFSAEKKENAGDDAEKEAEDHKHHLPPSQKKDGGPSGEEKRRTSLPLPLPPKGDALARRRTSGKWRFPARAPRRLTLQESADDVGAFVNLSEWIFGYIRTMDCETVPLSLPHVETVAKEEEEEEVQRERQGLYRAQAILRRIDKRDMYVEVFAKLFNSPYDPEKLRAAEKLGNKDCLEASLPASLLRKLEKWEKKNNGLRALCCEKRIFSLSPAELDTGTRTHPAERITLVNPRAMMLREKEERDRRRRALQRLSLLSLSPSSVHVSKREDIGVGTKKKKEKDLPLSPSPSASLGISGTSLKTSTTRMSDWNDKHRSVIVHEPSYLNNNLGPREVQHFISFFWMCRLNRAVDMAIEEEKTEDEEEDQEFEEGEVYLTEEEIKTLKLYFQNGMGQFEIEVKR